MKTDDLIERLAHGVEPVTPLHQPWQRTTTWLVWAFVYMGALTLMMTSSSHRIADGTGWWSLLPQIAAIAVSIAAAAAAFASVVPGVSPRVLLWPTAAVVVWLGSLLVEAFQEWQTIGIAGLATQREWLCVAMIAVGGALPAIGMALMLRHGAPLTPRTTTALAVLAAAALANVGACVSNPHTSSAVVLIWHGATVLSLVAVSSWAGRSVLSWDRIAHLN